MSDTKEMIDNLLQEKKVVVISKSYCPYCTKAKVRMLSYLDLIVHTFSVPQHLKLNILEF